MVHIFFVFHLHSILTSSSSSPSPSEYVPLLEWRRCYRHSRCTFKRPPSIGKAPYHVHVGVSLCSLYALGEGSSRGGWCHMRATVTLVAPRAVPCAVMIMPSSRKKNLHKARIPEQKRHEKHRGSSWPPLGKGLIEEECAFPIAANLQRLLGRPQGCSSK